MTSLESNASLAQHTFNESESLPSILNYQRIHDRLATSGQPTQEQLTWIADAGFRTVINLALTDASNALPLEDRAVLELGMDYIALPLLFDRPSVTQALRVLQLLQTLQDRPVWLHCAMNMRVSSLMYIYRTRLLGISESEAEQHLKAIWEPNPVWHDMIHQLSAYFKSTV